MGEKKTGHRSITIVLPEGDGEYMGIRTSGRERLSSIQKMPLLWEKSAVPSATDAVSANVTSELPNIDGRTNGSASNQSNGSDRKDTPEFSVVQGVGVESSADAGEHYSLKDAESVRDVVLETIPKLDESNKGDKNARVAAMKAIGGNLSKLRQAMGLPRHCVPLPLIKRENWVGVDDRCRVCESKRESSGEKQTPVHLLHVQTRKNRKELLFLRYGNEAIRATGG